MILIHLCTLISKQSHCIYIHEQPMNKKCMCIRGPKNEMYIHVAVHKLIVYMFICAIQGRVNSLEHPFKLCTITLGLHGQKVLLVPHLVLPCFNQHVFCISPGREGGREGGMRFYSLHLGILLHDVHDAHVTRYHTANFQTHFFSASSFCFLLHSLSNSSCLRFARRASYKSGEWGDNYKPKFSYLYCIYIYMYTYMYL